MFFCRITLKDGFFRSSRFELVNVLVLLLKLGYLLAAVFNVGE